jgi:hypothetical protein
MYTVPIEIIGVICERLPYCSLMEFSAVNHEIRAEVVKRIKAGQEFYMDSTLVTPEVFMQALGKFHRALEYRNRVLRTRARVYKYTEEANRFLVELPNRVRPNAAGRKFAFNFRTDRIRLDNRIPGFPFELSYLIVGAYNHQWLFCGIGNDSTESLNTCTNEQKQTLEGKLLWVTNRLNELKWFMNM